jgi:hypothetical protein
MGCCALVLATCAIAGCAKINAICGNAAASMGADRLSFHLLFLKRRKQRATPT